MVCTADLRNRLVLALDSDDPAVALRWAAVLGEWFGVVKVGSELFAAAGPPIVAGLRERGLTVFVDVKLADIPNTTRKAARVFGMLGASYLTVHTCAGLSVVQAGVEGLAEGAARAGLPAPMVLGVTVLTSEPEVSAGLLRSRAGTALEAGCGGVVCAAPDLAEVRVGAPGLLTVVPGIRLAGASADDQQRVATPAAAVRAGAGLLVIGRTVTGADCPEAAAEAVTAELAAALVP
jgi:orotidine-5'-phosphate decarboxylase